MESLRILLVPLLSEDVVKNLYFLSGALIACFYAPQIMRLIKDTTGAAAISLFAWAGWTVLRLPAMLYAILIPKDWVMFYVVLLDVMGRCLVLSVACYKRSKFNDAVGEKTGFSVIDIDSTEMIRLKRDVIERNTRVSSGYQSSTRVMMAVREKEEKNNTDNISLDTYVETEPMDQDGNSDNSDNTDNTVSHHVEPGHPWYRKKKN